MTCSGLFVCTAVLCLNYSHLKYSFFNLTECTPTPIYFKANLYLIADNTRASNLGNENLKSGFHCSHCTRQNFFARPSNTSDHCYRQTTRIKLTNFCFHRQEKPPCHCFPSNHSIEPMTDWINALGRPGKGLINTNRVNLINESASISVYILVGSVLFLVLLGGMIGVIFYWINSKSSQSDRLK